MSSENTTVKVSIILPIYNGEKTLKSTLESLLAQTFKDFELIACIDGTNDRSQIILETYRSRFKSVLILKNDINLGLGRTMNRLVSNTLGEYIAVAEQDDYYYPNRLFDQVKVLDNDDRIGMVSGISEFWNGKRVTGKFPGILVHGNQYPEGEDMFLLNYRNQVKVVNSCMMFRKSVHVKNGLYFSQHYPSISVDWTYVLRFCLLSKIYGISKSFVKLDRRMDRISVTSNKDKQFKAARELIRSFKYEFPDVINQKDYEYAIRTQNLMEMNAKSMFYFLGLFIKYTMIFPFEKRYYKSLKKRVLRKITYNEKN